MLRGIANLMRIRSMANTTQSVDSVTATIDAATEDLGLDLRATSLENANYRFIWCVSGSGQILSRHADIIRRHYKGSRVAHLIVITDSITAQAVHILHTVAPRVEVLSCSDVTVHRLSHDFVPDYTVMSESEIVVEEQILGPRAKWGKMRVVKDIITRLYGLRPGDALRIVRRSQLCGMSVVFRIVVET